MLLLIGADGNNLDSAVAKRFGHAEYYIMFDTESRKIEAVQNIDGEEHDHKNLLGFLESGVKVFIVGNIGPHAFEVINKPHTQIYLARKSTVKQAVESFMQNKLKLLIEPTAKKSIGHNHHHHDKK